MKILKVIIAALFVALFFPAGNANAQFGQNKVQYKKFDWQFIQSKHFDIYFHQGGRYLAEFAAHEIEKALEMMYDNIDYEIANRIPLIIFNSHNEFQQNNVIDEFLPEGVGGVTELFKNRIVLPFEGDYEKFRHVIHHELLHAYMNDMYYGGSIQNIISRNISLTFPLWFSEGMAEYQSIYGLDKETDMFMRDATIHNYVPPLDYMGGYFAYRGGQSFFSYLADTYGEEKIGILMNNVKTFSDVESGFRETYKVGLRELDEKWQRYLKRTYWPDLKTREDVRDFAKQLTNHKIDGGNYNIAPAISPDGQKFAFISNKDDLFDVYIARTKNGEIIKKVIEGNNSSDFEELHILTPGLAWSKDGRKLALSAKSSGSDIIYVIDIEDEDWVQLPVKFETINFMSWSPKGNIIAFIGSKADRSDLYLYDIALKKLTPLTSDYFSDQNPTWSLDGKTVFFTSDRGDYTDPAKIPSDFKMWEYDYSGIDYYGIDVATKKMTRYSNSKDTKEGYVQISSDGNKILYVSDMNGIKNIYVRERDSSGKVTDRPITNSLNPIDQLSLSKDGKKLLFVSLNEGGYDIFSLDNPFERKIEMDSLPPTEFVIRQRENQALIADYNSGKDSRGLKDSKFLSDSSLVASSIDNKSDTASFITDGKAPESGEIQDSDKNAKFYGEDVVVDLGKTGQETKIPSLSERDASNPNFNLYDNVNPDGSFKIKNYKVKFSPDLVYGNAAYTSFYGFQGLAQISLSDLLGDHRIIIQTSMVIDLKNSDYAVGYYYLPKRTDFGIYLYHTARFVNYGVTPFQSFLYRYRTIGGTLSASYPISRFKRIDGLLTGEFISRENLDYTLEPTEDKLLFVPSISLVHDNTVFGYTSPVSGTRYNFTLMASPKLGPDGIGFGSLLGDLRHYMKLGDDYTFVTRVTGGASFGPNPQRFFIGGMANWINYDYENTTIPIEDIQDFAFSSPGLPLRGFNYDRLSGSKYAIANIELRFPLLKYLVFGAIPFGFANIEGVAFVDAGTAWTDELSLIRELPNGTDVTEDLLIGTGLGARVNLLGFPFMFDVAWRYNLQGFSEPKYYVSLGYNF